MANLSRAIQAIHNWTDKARVYEHVAATFIDISVYLKNCARISSQKHFKIKLKLCFIRFAMQTSPKMFLQHINMKQIDLFLLQQKCSRNISLTVRPYDLATNVPATFL